MATLTPAQLKAIRAALDKALEPVVGTLGIASLKAGNCSYTAGGSFTFKVEGNIEGGMTKEASAYESMRQRDDSLPPLGFTFLSQAQEHKVIGSNTTGSKVLTECNGRRLLWKVAAIQSYYRRAKGDAAKVAQA